MIRGHRSSNKRFAADQVIKHSCRSVDVVAEGMRSVTVHGSKTG